MKNWFDTKNVKRWNKTRILLNVGTPVTGLLLLYIITVFIFILPDAEKHLIEERKEQARMATSIVESLLNEYHEDVKDKILSLQEAQTLAKSRIRRLRFGEDKKDYCWILDEDINLLVHPYRPDLENTDVRDYEDEEGFLVFDAMDKIIKKQGAGFVDYHWQWKDNPELVLPKVSYVQRFKPWNWIIGSGVYYNDINAHIQKTTTDLFVWSLVVLVLIAILSLSLVIFSVKTEKKIIHFQDALKNSLNRYYNLFESANDGILLISEGRIINCNKKAIEMFEAPNKSSIVGSTLAELSPEYQADGFRSHDHKRVKKLKAEIIERETFRWTHKKTTGEVFEAEVSLSAQQINNKLYVLAILRDVTQKIETEKSLLETNKTLEETQNILESKLKEIGELNISLKAFDYSVSNALRAPLRRIAAFFDLMSSEEVKSDPEEREHYAQRVKRNINEMKRLIDSLLKLSRASNDEIEYEELDLSILAGRAMNKIQTEYPDREIEFVIQKEAKCKGDIDLLYFVISHLFENAAKYNQSVENLRIEFQAREKGSKVECRVIDNGVGMDAEKQTNLFKPFHTFFNDQRLESYGLGLTTLQLIINRHNGEISVESSPGKGTTIIFTLEK